MQLYISGDPAIPTLSINPIHVYFMEHFPAVDLVLVGDGFGVDLSAQHLAQLLEIPTVVYYSGMSPRNAHEHSKTVHVPALGSGNPWVYPSAITMLKRADTHLGFIDKSLPQWRKCLTVKLHNRALELGKVSLLYDISTGVASPDPVDKREPKDLNASSNRDALQLLGEHMRDNYELWQKEVDVKGRALLNAVDLTTYSKRNGEPLALTYPLLTEAECDDLIGLSHRGEYATNPAEPVLARIPEVVLEDKHPNVHAELESLFFTHIQPLVMATFGIHLKTCTSIQLAVYETVGGVQQGVFHSDQDSDVSITVALNDDYLGGGLTILSGGLHSETVSLEPQKTGVATMFKGRTMLHRGESVLSGTRHLLVFWCR